jgi:hypothetical protein
VSRSDSELRPSAAATAAVPLPPPVAPLPPLTEDGTAALLSATAGSARHRKARCSAENTSAGAGSLSTAACMQAYTSYTPLTSAAAVSYQANGKVITADVTRAEAAAVPFDSEPCEDAPVEAVDVQVSYLVCPIQQQVQVHPADRQVLVETGVLHDKLGVVPCWGPAAAGGDAVIGTGACSAQRRLLVLDPKSIQARECSRLQAVTPTNSAWHSEGQAVASGARRTSHKAVSWPASSSTMC